MIIGAPGSGKSTLARKLGVRTGLPVVHIDLIHWMPGWEERPKADKIAMIRPLEEQEDWIIEGGLSATYDTRLARADTLIWLDMPIALRLYRVIRRLMVTYGKNRPDLPEGCPEVLGWHTWEFLVYILRTRGPNRRRMRVRHGAFADAGRTALHFNSRKGVEAWLDALDP
ncbi:MAG: AAA family ATPase [Pseudomonadota bacterium]